MNLMNSSQVPSRRRSAALTGLAALAAAALLLGGCASKVRLDPPAPVEDRATPGSTVPLAPVTPGTGSGPAGQSQVTPVDLGANGGASSAKDALAANGRVIYFDFDSYTVKDEYISVIDRNARWLNADRKRSLVLEGHTDERGGSEYNLALGQKRADAVARSLGLLGVKDSQVEAVSFGKERPAVAGSGEDAWAKNRRVELRER